MSLISKQIDELRAYAKDNNGELAKLISDAADTIEELSAKLHSANMERSSQYYNDGWVLYNMIKSFNQEEKLDYVVDILDQIKESNPNQTIIIETPGKSVSCKLKDALIYIGAKNEIVIDAE